MLVTLMLAAYASAAVTMMPAISLPLFSFSPLPLDYYARHR